MADRRLEPTAEQTTIHPASLNFSAPEWPFHKIDPNDCYLSEKILSGPSAIGVNPAQVVALAGFGVPFDRAVLGRKGTAEGPRAIRKAARTLKAASPSGMEIGSYFWDWGDLILDPLLDVRSAHEIVVQATLLLQSQIKARCPSAIRVMLGGDHSLVYPCLRHDLACYRERLAAVNLDAHLDVRETPVGTQPNSGSGFGRLLDEGLINYAVLGAREHATSGYYIEKLRSLGDGALLRSAMQLHQTQIDLVAQETLAWIDARADAFYLSIDLDVADLSVAPGVSAPGSGGLMPYQLLRIVELLSRSPKLLAIDLVELAPPYDTPSECTAHLAAACLAACWRSRNRLLLETSA